MIGKKSKIQLILLLIIVGVFYRCDNSENLGDDRTINIWGEFGLGQFNGQCRQIALRDPKLFQLSAIPVNEDLVQEAEKLCSSGMIKCSYKQDSYEINDPIESQGSLLTSESSETITLTPQLEEVPFCNYEAKAHYSRGKIFLLGSIPDIEISDSDLKKLHDEKTIDDEIYQKTLRHHLLQTHPNDLENFKILEEGSCISVGEDKQLLMSKKIEFHLDGMPYVARVHHTKVLDLQENFFHGSGSANILVYDSFSEQSKNFIFKKATVDLVRLSNGDHLCSDRFLHQEIEASNRMFIYDESDPKIEDLTLFHNAMDMSNWYNSIAHSLQRNWPGPVIQLYVDDSKNRKNNTAVYLPTGSFIDERIPMVKVGDGDGIELRNLLKDPDVISHEIGHHIVYRNLTSTSGESLVLHEGLADFFVLAKKNKSTCFAEYICPHTSRICVSNSCLRSADNQWKITDDNLPPEGHKKSQIISSMLWNVIQRLGADNTAKITYRAVSFLSSNSGYKDFILALLLSAKELSSSQKACDAIYEEAKKRNFTNYIGNVTCSSL